MRARLYCVVGDCSREPVYGFWLCKECAKKAKGNCPVDGIHYPLEVCYMKPAKVRKVANAR